MSDKLASLALLAGGDELAATARYYEERDGYADKAVMLYHQAGQTGRALDLAFRTEQSSALELIARDLVSSAAVCDRMKLDVSNEKLICSRAPIVLQNAQSDPHVLERAAHFFSANQQDRQAVVLLAYARRFGDAVELCRAKNVIVNDEIADLLTPERNGRQRKSTITIAIDCL